MNLEQIYFTVKITASMMIIGSLAYFGFNEGHLLGERLIVLKEMYRLIVLLRGEIQYAARPIPEATGRIARRTYGRFREFLESVSSQLYLQSGDTLPGVWKKQVQIYFEDSPLKSEDIQLIKELGDNLGYMDRKTQLEAVELCLDNFRLQIKALESQIPVKKKLYRCLGVFTGLMFVILLI